MRRKDQFDEFAELCVLEDGEGRSALEAGNDARLAEYIAKLARQHFGHGYDRLARSSDPLDGLDTP